MSVQELLLRVLYAAKPLLPFMLISALLTAAALALLLALSRNLWFDKKGFGWLGIFYGMQGYQCVRFAAAWIKLCLLLISLAAFQKLTLPHYLLLAIAGLLYAVDPQAPLRTFVNLVGSVMALAGLLAANIVCGYIQDLRPGAGFVVVYVFMSLFLALYGVYLFLNELNDLSLGRRAQLGE